MVFPLIPRPRVEVILMENDSVIQNTVKDILEEELNFRVTLIDNTQTAVSLIDKTQTTVSPAGDQESYFFLLDVHMGESREQEGLNALEEIKGINSNIPVFVLSAHQQYETLANNLNADGFIHKQADLKEVIRSKIEPEILKHALGVLEAHEQVLEAGLQDTRDELEKLYKKLDPNVQAYENLINSKESLNQYKGQYIAFLNGNIIDSDLNKTKLLQRLQHHHPKESCFLKKIQQYNDTIELPYYELV
ncbi:response regulator [Crocosphaera sp.]|uniref:response regulator n=1 Tax=Crocosphaera sp. TaxID=2729996 RepID=UPI0026080046|nr:response regulator [Crocosphaera sp.]MDJ0580661.1 response regulator [Crocosphaera sp.]